MMVVYTAATLIQGQLCEEGALLGQTLTHTYPNKVLLNSLIQMHQPGLCNRLKLWASSECKRYIYISSINSVSEHLQCFDEADL
jgi:hypothetical protein